VGDIKEVQRMHKDLGEERASGLRRRRSEEEEGLVCILKLWCHGCLCGVASACSKAGFFCVCASCDGVLAICVIIDVFVCLFS
jgi:hypothetical protein